MSVNIQGDDNKVNFESEQGLRNNRRVEFVVWLQVYDYKPSLICFLECSRSSVANSADF